MKKTIVKIIVQGRDQTAAEFAEQLEEKLAELQVSLNMPHPPGAIFTTASDGRQTANIQFVADIPSKKVDPMEALKEALDGATNIKSLHWDSLSAQWTIEYKNGLDDDKVGMNYLIEHLLHV